MAPKGSLPHSQQPATFSSPEPDQFSLHPSYFFTIHFDVILPAMSLSLRCHLPCPVSISLPQVSPPKPCFHISPSGVTSHAHIHICPSGVTSQALYPYLSLRCHLPSPLSISLPQVSPPKPCIHISSLPCKPLAPTLSSTLISSPE